MWRPQGGQQLDNTAGDTQGNYATQQMAAQAANRGTTPAAPPDQENDQANRSGGDRNWSARIRASIARLIEIDGICLDSKNYTNAAEKLNAREAEQAFHAKVDELEAASKTAHQEYWDRLQGVYSASTAKKMRLTTAGSDSPPGNPAATTTMEIEMHEALDTLAVAEAPEQDTGRQVSVKPPATTTSTAKKTQRGNQRQNALHSDEQADTPQNPVQVYDAALVKAVDKLTDKLTQLLNQLQATSDAAVAKPILATVATLALEVSEMQRYEQVALARMMEIEQHRQQIMQGLLEYEKRKEQLEVGEETKDGAPDSRDSLSPLQNSSTNADGQQM